MSEVTGTESRFFEGTRVVRSGIVNGRYMELLLNTDGNHGLYPFLIGPMNDGNFRAIPGKYGCFQEAARRAETDAELEVVPVGRIQV